MKRLLCVLALGLIFMWGLSVDIGARANFETVPGDAGDPVPGGDDHGWGGENNSPGDFGGDTEGAIMPTPTPAPAPSVTSFSTFWNIWVYDRWLQSQPRPQLDPRVNSRRSTYRSYRTGRYSVRK